MLVETTKGMIDIEQLEIEDIVTVSESSRDVATEWRLNGELVRRDVTVSMLRTPDLTSTEGVLNG